MRIHVVALNMGWIHAGLAMALVQVAADTRRVHSISIEFSGVGVERRPIASNRNRIARDCPKDAEMLVMIDADCVPPLNFLDAADADLDIIGLPMPMYDRTGRIMTGIVPLDNRETVEVGRMEVIEASAVAAGVLFIHRRVLEHPEMRAPFEDKFDEDGVLTWTEDHVFCERARKLGFQVWANLGYPLGHVKEIDIRHIWAQVQPEHSCVEPR